MTTCAHAWALLKQPDGQAAAAAAFLRVLQHDPSCREAQRALHYQRWADGVMVEQLPALAQLVEQLERPGLLQRVLADWHYRVGEREQAVAYYANQWRGTDLAGMPLGGLPQALVIGAPKSGTTSLMAALQRHPRLYPHPRKELHFFQARWHWGDDWYRLQFPSWGRGLMEATPNYLQDPLVPERVATLLPQVKVVAVLREPLRRAVSWLEHLRRWGGLDRPVDAVLREELELLEAMPEQERRNLGWWGTNALAGSLYGDQLRRWRQWIPEHRLLVLRFEDLCLNPSGCLAQILKFLDADITEPSSLPALPKLNQAPGLYANPAIDLAIRCRTGLLVDALDVWSSL